MTWQLVHNNTDHQWDEFIDPDGNQLCIADHDDMEDLLKYLNDTVKTLKLVRDELITHREVFEDWVTRGEMNPKDSLFASTNRCLLSIHALRVINYA